jgi:tellurite methyltransferase
MNDSFVSPVLVGAKEELLAREGRALDIACGAGRNAIYLARLGFKVEAVDIAYDKVYQARNKAVSLGLNINFWVADLKVFPLSASRYDLIVNINFLLRDLIEPIHKALKPGGLLIFQTYTQEDDHYKNKFKNFPERFLRPREILFFFPSYRIWYQQEGPFEGRHIASLIAEKPGEKKSPPSLII